MDYLEIKSLTDLKKVRCLTTGEVRFIAGDINRLEFLKKNPDYVGTM